MLEYVPLVGHEDAHAVLELPLLVEDLHGAAVELHDDLRALEEGTLVVALEVRLALTLLEDLGLEGLGQGDL